MSERKLTGWFPANVKPARAGVYQVGYLSTMGMVILYPYSYHQFDGEEWIFDADYYPAKRFKGQRTPLEKMYSRSVFWRGLAEEPQ